MSLEEIREEIETWFKDNFVGKPTGYEAYTYDEEDINEHLYAIIFHGYEYTSDFKEFLETKFGFKHIEADGGEGQGSHAYAVFEMNGKTYRIETWYALYDGYGLDDDFWDWEEVEPYTEVVTKYKKRG